MSDLRKSMGGTVGTFMALSTILGSGMMILPGTSYYELGKSAWLPWAVAALSVVPLLYCYGWLGRRYPSASGISYYAEIGVGKSAGRGAGLLAMLALVAGIPATAITGGRYIAEFSGIASLAWVFPVTALGVAAIVAWVGATVSSKLQVGLILTLFALVLAAAAVILIGHGQQAVPGTAFPRFSRLGGILTAVYVAFTGWETVAFTFEEHKRPDLIPRIFAASYLIVVALYALLLFSLFAVVRPGETELNFAPLLLLAERSLGALGRPVMLLLVVASITANVVASVLALSRLVFGMARSGHLPARLSRLRGRDDNPVTSVCVVGVVLTVIAILGATGLVHFESLFILSGGIYFVLYGIGAASFWRLARGSKTRAIGVLCAVVVVAVTVLAGPPLWWCWALFAVVCTGSALIGGRRRGPGVAVRAATVDGGSKTHANR